MAATMDPPKAKARDNHKVSAKAKASREEMAASRTIAEVVVEAAEGKAEQMGLRDNQAAGVSNCRPNSPSPNTRGARCQRFVNISFFLIPHFAIDTKRIPVTRLPSLSAARSRYLHLA